MLTWPQTVRIFVCVEPTDMRCGFDRLAATAAAVTGQDPLGGYLFVFFNRRRNRVKILCWDKSGYCLWYKRLEAGTFHLVQDGKAAMEWDRTQLTLILEGIDLSGSKQRKRFSLSRQALPPTG
jgi:transposase